MSVLNRFRDEAPALLAVLYERGWIVSGFFGALVFLIIAGPAPHDVTNVAWLYAREDTAGAQSGWEFFRSAPWVWPIALNPTYGMDFAGSILFSDSVPLLALLFKALSPLLPENFQYFGLWAFASFVLQGVFGWLLMSRASEHPGVRILGAMLICVTPLYWLRLVAPACSHMSLTAHWIVLAALYLALPPHSRRPWLWWGLLVVGTAFVHAYLFVMVATIWLADLARRAWTNWRTVWPEPLGVGTALAALVIGTGVWAGPAGEAQGGLGWFKMNALSFIDPNLTAWGVRDEPSWSHVLPDIPNWDWGGDFEGFAFLGLGGLIVAIAAAWAAWTVVRKSTWRSLLPYAPLALVLVGLGIFALSRNVSFGNVNFYLWWPAPLEQLGGLFRATGRFIWPLYYAFFFVAVLLLALRAKPRLVMAVLAAAVIVQAVDTTGGWARDSAYLRVRGPSYQTQLRSDFWRQAGERYDAVRIAPHQINHPNYLDVAFFALAHDMPTDAMYLARTSSEATQASRARVEHGIASGDWPADTLFVLDEDLARRAAETLDRNNNVLARVDGLIVLAPAWTGCAECGAEQFP